MATTKIVTGHHEQTKASDADWDDCNSETSETLDIVLEFPDVPPHVLHGCSTYSISGLETDMPFLKLGDYLFVGTYEETIGTSMLFSDCGDVPELAPADGAGAEADVTEACRYVSKTSKKIIFRRYAQASFSFLCIVQLSVECRC